MSRSQARFRKDYQAPAYTVTTMDLTFELSPSRTVVTAICQYEQKRAEPLFLDGQHLELLSVQVDGKSWPYQKSEQGIELTNLPVKFALCVVTAIAPNENTALEGLYLSGGAYCTQCEAEGFRRITYFQDRPDVLAIYTTHIIADAAFPHLLSNGNRLSEQMLPDGRRKVSWHDPFPKPCYLFALVAGNFALVEDSFTTQSGRTVTLQFYVDQGNASQAEFAVGALQRAMRFDEERFGLEYDLDIYMVVAVDFFNMGAMENKGLNIFNSKYVLADANSATDTDYYLIESIIGHEYFHNWTGNRVTCRDWFQLSLKEGLTVFRDQEFSAAMSSASLCRIDAIKTIRSAQFAEDASPMAHPIRPDSVEEMNNFYTVTVYDKGAEVIRMQQTLLGLAGFRRGLDLYFARHDGQAVTCDDFIAAMADANGKDFSQFSRWYSQSGTPHLHAQLHYKHHAVALELSQVTLPTADQKEKYPLLIPLRYELHDASGQVLTGLLEMKAPQQQFEFEGLTAPVIPVLLADFSAPIQVHYDYSLTDLLYLVGQAEDAVARWDAMQTIWLQLVKHSLQEGSPQPLPDALIATFSAWLNTPLADLAFCAELLTLPSYDTLAQHFSPQPVDDLIDCLANFERQLAVRLQQEWHRVYQQLPFGPYQYNSEQVGRRALRNVALHYLSWLPQSTELLIAQYQQADNMTDRLAVLHSMVKASHGNTAAMLQQFVSDYGSNPLLFDKFSQLTAQRRDADVWQALTDVSLMPSFDWHNPNRVRSLYYAFVSLNPSCFHQPDGRGYQLLGDIVLKADALNPQLAARLITPLLSYRRFDEQRAVQMQSVLHRLQMVGELSSDLSEKVQKALNVH